MMIRGSTTVASLREALELSRRADLHRQVAALKAAAEKLAGDPGKARTRTYFKLRSKIRRKERELLQPMLVCVLR